MTTPKEQSPSHEILNPVEADAYIFAVTEILKAQQFLSGNPESLDGQISYEDGEDGDNKVQSIALRIDTNEDEEFDEFVGFEVVSVYDENRKPLEAKILQTIDGNSPSRRGIVHLLHPAKGQVDQYIQETSELGNPIEGGYTHGAAESNDAALRYGMLVSDFKRRLESALATRADLLDGIAVVAQHKEESFAQLPQARHQGFLGHLATRFGKSGGH